NERPEIAAAPCDSEPLLANSFRNVQRSKPRVSIRGHATRLVNHLRMQRQFAHVEHQLDVARVWIPLPLHSMISTRNQPSIDVAPRAPPGGVQKSPHRARIERYAGQGAQFLGAEK